jgi:hypothetical protein
MLKQLTLAAFALCSVAAMADEGWSIDPMTASTSDMKKFVVKHAYKTMNAGDAYVLSNFLNRIPSNAENALLRGLTQNAVQAKMIREENQTWANSQPPIGDGTFAMTNTSWSSDNTVSDSSRPMRMFAAKPDRDLNYWDSIKITTSGLGVIDQGLIWNLFTDKSYTESQIPTVNNERELDAITHFIEANAKWTEPYRLKYTSLVPKSY